MSSINSNKPFNEDGPVKISEDSFKVYQSKHKRYQDWWCYTIADWITRPYPKEYDDVLRLCLRDLLRQNYSRSRSNYYNMKISYITLLHCEDYGGFFENVCKSEQLRNEFAEEAVYNIEHGLVPPSISDDASENDFTELLELLIVLGDAFQIETIDINKLWKLHPVNQPCESDIEYNWKNLQFYSHGMHYRLDEAKTIRHFYEEVWNRIENSILKYIETCHETLKQRGSLYSEKHPYNSEAIYLDTPNDAKEFLTRFCASFSGTSVVIFEQHLDPCISYLTFKQLKDSLPHFHDETLACRCLQRHINNASDEELETFIKGDKNNSQHSVRVFLHWALALCTRGEHFDDGRSKERLLKLLPPLKTADE